MSIIEDFLLCIVVLRLRDNIAQGVNLCKVVPRSIKTLLQKIFLYNVVKIHEIILHKKITCAMLT